MSALFPGPCSLQSCSSSLPRHLGLPLLPLYPEMYAVVVSVLQTERLMLS